MEASAIRRPVDLAEVDPGKVVDEYESRGLEALPDAQLVGLCAAVIDAPKEAPPDSFVLHAPLELMARASLLGRVEPTARLAARQRLVWLAASYAAAGPATAAVRPVEYVDTARATEGLAAAVRAGDLDAAEAAVTWLARQGGALDLVAALTDVVVPSLAGAAHGGIFLHQLVSYEAPGPVSAPGARAFARELARRPDWQLGWFRDRDKATEGGAAADLVECLRRPVSPGPLDSNYIFPTMRLTESSGLAAEVLGPPLVGLGRRDARAALLRVAAWSMLQDDPDHAPYGWSHCLTMPHGLLGVAGLATRPDDVVAVAATYVLGFRATLGRRSVDPGWAPASGPSPDPIEQLGGPPDEAAAAVWHAAPEQVAPLAGRLASYAAAHPDAHLAKYTLACLQQTRSDPDAGRLYLAAAAFLGAWWRAQRSA